MASEIKNTGLLSAIVFAIIVIILLIIGLFTPWFPQI
ncbi:MAG: hypothetical protein BWY43_00147 [candidate division WS2 bacterium ADurb.Bin280]|uniref:Uncharacterized protein n=1 Tax=candidate division WS2 bacterium ADurb.Bin280 TaxID=1852829 RepID=A0A1V5SFA7_9BACT|nr:MAG: hypothetical protein BWY43_00147 [candidate division WS2 bacterium ADurb.Bin280]